MKIYIMSLKLCFAFLASLTTVNSQEFCKSFDFIPLYEIKSEHSRQRIFNDFKGAVIRITVGNGEYTKKQGTGFLVDSRRGYVLTAYHNVKDALKNNSLEIFGESDVVTKTSMKHVGDLHENHIDIALLQFSQPKNLSLPHPLDLSFRGVDQGLSYFTLGYTKKRNLQVSTAIHNGYEKVRSLDKNDVEVMAVSNPTFKGDSGSPLIDVRGLVVGLAIQADNTNNEGFYIPIKEVVELLKKNLPLSERMKNLDKRIRERSITADQLAKFLRNRGYITNTELYRWSQHVKNYYKDYKQSMEYFNCPIEHALFDRRLGISILSLIFLSPNFISDELAAKTILNQGRLAENNSNDATDGSAKDQTLKTVTYLVQNRTKPGAGPVLERLAEGKIAPAVEYFEEIAALSKDSSAKAEAHRHIGAIKYSKDTTKAIEAYQHATQLDPLNADGWNQLGHLLLRVGNSARAIYAYDKVQKIRGVKQRWQFDRSSE